MSVCCFDETVKFWEQSVEFVSFLHEIFFLFKKTSLHLFFHLTYFHDGVFCFIFPKSGDTSVLIVG